MITDLWPTRQAAGQRLEPGASKGSGPIDDRGPDPLRVIYGDPLLLFGSSSPGDPLARDIYAKTPQSKNLIETLGSNNIQEGQPSRIRSPIDHEVEWRTRKRLAAQTASANWGKAVPNVAVR